MKKSVTMKVNEELYFKLVALKGKLKCKTWDELFKKLIGRYL